MTSVRGLNGYNNLLARTNSRNLASDLEHKAARIPLDLSFKGYNKTNEVLTAKASQINGKFGDIKYMPNSIHSRPYTGYDARFDPTILDAVRNKLVDVSGRYIPNRNLQKNTHATFTQRPLIPTGVQL
jgi:hypothetical protein